MSRNCLHLALASILVAGTGCDATGPDGAPAVVVSLIHAYPIERRYLPGGTVELACDVTLGARASTDVTWSGAHFRYHQPYADSTLRTDSLDAAAVADLWGSGTLPAGILFQRARRFSADEPFALEMRFSFTDGGGRPGQSTFVLPCLPPAPPLSGTFVLLTVGLHALPAEMATADTVFSASITFHPNMTLAYHSYASYSGYRIAKSEVAAAYDIISADSVFLWSVAGLFSGNAAVVGPGSLTVDVGYILRFYRQGN